MQKIYDPRAGSDRRLHRREHHRACIDHFLWLGTVVQHRLASAAAEVGLLFVFVVLTTGPLWARQQRGMYWAWWDMRLTLTLFLAFVVAAYLVMRDAIEDEAMRARYSAVLGRALAVSIPFIHLSVYLFQARLHPMPVALKPGEPSMSPQMMWTFFPADVVFAIMCIAFIRARYQRAARHCGIRRGLRMHLDSAETYHVVYVWVTFVYVAYTVSLAIRARRFVVARATPDERYRLPRRRGPGRPRAPRSAAASCSCCATPSSTTRWRRSGVVGLASVQDRATVEFTDVGKRGGANESANRTRSTRYSFDSRVKESALSVSRVAIRSSSGAGAKRRRRLPPRRLRLRSCRA